MPALQAFPGKWQGRGLGEAGERGQCQEWGQRLVDRKKRAEEVHLGVHGFSRASGPEGDAEILSLPFGLQMGKLSPGKAKGHTVS